MRDMGKEGGRPYTEMSLYHLNPLSQHATRSPIEQNTTNRSVAFPVELSFVESLY